MQADVLEMRGMRLPSESRIASGNMPFLLQKMRIQECHLLYPGMRRSGQYRQKPVKEGEKS